LNYFWSIATRAVSAIAELLVSFYANATSVHVSQKSTNQSLLVIKTQDNKAGLKHLLLP